MLTVEKAHQLLSEMLQRGVDPDRPLEIRTADSSIGPCAAVKITAIYEGFDWDTGRVLIQPEEMVRRAGK